MSEVALGIKKHRKLHACAAESYDDEALFKDPPPKEDCPILLPTHAIEIIDMLSSLASIRDYNVRTNPGLFNYA